MAPATVTYSKAGTQPPVFLAGDFSGWECMEMDHELEEGEYQFYKTIEAEESKELQYKFRVGLGDWWVLDETSPIVTDDIGNRNNLLIMPTNPASAAGHADEGSPKEQSHSTEQTEEKELAKEDSQLNGNHTEAQASTPILEVVNDNHIEAQTSTPNPEIDSTAAEVASTAAEVSESAAILDRELDTPEISDSEAGKIGFRRMSKTPIPEVADTAAEVADSAAALDQEESEELISEIASIAAEVGDSAATLDEDAAIPEMSDSEATRFQRASTPPVLEVSDSAAELDRDESEMPIPETAKVNESAVISDEDAAILEISDTEVIGVRRMSTTPIPEVADTAAEVADIAAELDREESSTPDLTEEEAGRIGRRRMSLTPISQVADTAAEVAAVAALLDRDPRIEILPGNLPFDHLGEYKEYPTTPEDERVPLLSHEKFIPSGHASPPKSPEHDANLDPESSAITPGEHRTPLSSQVRYMGSGSNDSPRCEDLIPTPADPEHLNPRLYNILELPSTREGIMVTLAKLQVELPEDDIRLTSPPSHMSPLQQSDKPDILTPVDSPRGDHRNSPFQDPRTKSLESIAEENDHVAAEEAEINEDSQTTHLSQDNENPTAEQYAQISKIVEDVADPEQITAVTIHDSQPAVLETTEESTQLVPQPDQESAKNADIAADEAAEEIVIEDQVLPDSQELLVPLGIPPGSSEQELDKAPAEFVDLVAKEDVQDAEAQQDDGNVGLEQAIPTSEIIGTGDDIVSDDTPETTPPASNEGDFSDPSAPIDVAETAAHRELVSEAEYMESRSIEAPTIAINPATILADLIPAFPNEPAIIEDADAEARPPKPEPTSASDETAIADEVNDEVSASEPQLASVPGLIQEDASEETHILEHKSALVTDETEEGVSKEAHASELNPAPVQDAVENEAYEQTSASEPQLVDANPEDAVEKTDTQVESTLIPDAIEEIRTLEPKSTPAPDAIEKEVIEEASASEPQLIPVPDAIPEEASEETHTQELKSALIPDAIEEANEEAHTPKLKSTLTPDEAKTHVHTQQQDVVVTEVFSPEPTTESTLNEAATDKEANDEAHAPESQTAPDAIQEEAHTSELKSTPVPVEVKTHIHTQQEDTVATAIHFPEHLSGPVPDEVKSHIHTQQEDTVITSKIVSDDTASNEFSEPSTAIFTESRVTKRKSGNPSTEQPESAAMDGTSSIHDKKLEHPGLIQMFCTAVVGWFGGFFAKMCGDREKNKKAKKKGGDGKVKRVIGVTVAVLLIVVVLNAVRSKWG